MPEHLAAKQSQPDVPLAERLALSPGEFAAAIGVSLPHVHNMIRRGELRSVKLGRRRLILATELERLATDPRSAACIAAEQSGGDA